MAKREWLEPMAFTDLSTPEKIILKANLESLFGIDALKLRELARTRIEERPRPLHLDFSKTKYLDSISISGLLYLYQMLRGFNCKVVIDDASENVRKLFTNLTLDRIFVMPRAFTLPA